MINVDISNVWGQVSLPDLLGMEADVFEAHRCLMDHCGEGYEYLGWLDLPTAEETPELRRIRMVAKRIRETSDVMVVVGIGGSYLGVRAGIELLQGTHRNLGKGKGDPVILYAGNTLSTRAWNELCRLLEGKDFSIVIISKSGMTTEPAIVTRSLYWMLARRYGTEGAKHRTYVITDPTKGALRLIADEEGWESFSIPPDVGGRYSVLSAVGMLPMAVAGIDPLEVLRGAAEVKEEYDIRSFENPVWLYAAARNLLYRHGRCVEIMASFIPDFRAMGNWWQQLFGESEGKKCKGIFPVTAEFTTDLHSLGQMIQQGERNMFETMIRFDPPEKKLTIGEDIKDRDELNYLAGRTLDEVEEKAYLGTLEAHVDGDVPVITMEMGELTPAKLGEMFYFFELSCGISAYMLGVNPFDQPGVEHYKRNMFRLLGKPGYEK